MPMRRLIVVFCLLLCAVAPAAAQDRSDGDVERTLVEVIAQLFAGKSDAALARYRQLLADHPENFTIRERVLPIIWRSLGREAFLRERGALETAYTLLKPQATELEHGAFYLYELFTAAEGRYNVDVFKFYPQDGDPVITNHFIFFVERTADGEKLGYLLLAHNRKENEALREMGDLRPGQTSYYLRHYLPTAPDGTKTSGLIRFYHLPHPPRFDVTLDTVLKYLRGELGIVSGSTQHPDGRIELFFNKSFLE